MQKVQVRVNERGALNNGRFSFTHKYTLVSELLQNARRAGATEVRVDYDADAATLTVTDNGRGVEDFQKLLTLNESGWDEQVVAAERAFGVGFSKVLYSAVRCTVTSRGKRLAFETCKALDQHPLDVADDSSGDPAATVVHLEGVALGDLAARIERLASGFPVPVFFNGKPLERPYAETALACTDTTIGRIHLHGYRTGALAVDTLLFLQGFPISEPTCWYGEPVDIVHLDARIFIARLPDRTQLIDAEEQCRRVDDAIRSLWRFVLVRRKAELPAAEFIDRFFTIAQRSGHIDLFDDVPLLPRQVCYEIVGYPIQEGYDARDYVCGVPAHLERAAVERGEIYLADLDATDDENFAYWMYARARRCVLVHAYRLGERHWIHPFVRRLQDEPIAVTIVGETHRAVLDGRFIWPAVVLCDRYTIAVGTDLVELRDEALFHEDQLIAPAGERTGEAVRQASSYIDGDDRFCGDDLEADRCALARLIGNLRADDPTATLRCLLGDLPLEHYPLLAGRRFRITVGTVRGGHSVELVE